MIDRGAEFCNIHAGRVPKVTSQIDPSKITADAITPGHIPIAIWNGKQGEESKMGVRHLYSEAYREKWPEDQYPEKYEKDVEV